MGSNEDDRMNLLMMLPDLIAKGKGADGDLAALNQALWSFIPFNGPHGFCVEELGEDFVKTRAPYKKENFNHIQGIHACAIATIAEFSSGLLLLSKVDPLQYRLIMAKMAVEYHYQAKQDTFAVTYLTAEQIEREIIAPLREVDSLLRGMMTEVRDHDGNLVATAQITWQIKPWDKVRTAVAG
jgi:acyl-coenzyme A thioesterase PaaI-like protein